MIYLVRYYSDDGSDWVERAFLNETNAEKYISEQNYPTAYDIEVYEIEDEL